MRSTESMFRKFLQHVAPTELRFADTNLRIRFLNERKTFRSTRMPDVRRRYSARVREQVRRQRNHRGRADVQEMHARIQGRARRSAVCRSREDRGGQGRDGREFRLAVDAFYAGRPEIQRAVPRLAAAREAGIFRRQGRSRRRLRQRPAHKARRRMGSERSRRHRSRRRRRIGVRADATSAERAHRPVRYFQAAAQKSVRLRIQRRRSASHARPEKGVSFARVER